MVTVRSHPRLVPVDDVRSSSTHSTAGPADSSNVMVESKNKSAPSPVLKKIIIVSSCHHCKRALYTLF